MAGPASQPPHRQALSRSTRQSSHGQEACGQQQPHMPQHSGVACQHGAKSWQLMNGSAIERTPVHAICGCRLRPCGCEFVVTNPFDSSVTSPILSCASPPDLGEGSCNCAITPACIHHGCRREYRCRVLARVRLASRVHCCCCSVGHRSQLAPRSVPQLQATKRHTPTATCCGPSAARNRSQGSWGRWQALACRLRG